MNECVYSQPRPLFVVILSCLSTHHTNIQTHLRIRYIHPHSLFSIVFTHKPTFTQQTPNTLKRRTCNYVLFVLFSLALCPPPPKVSNSLLCVRDAMLALRLDNADPQPDVDDQGLCQGPPGKRAGGDTGGYPGLSVRCRSYGSCSISEPVCCRCPSWSMYSTSQTGPACR